MARVQGCRGEESLPPKPLLQDPTPPKVPRRWSKRDRNGTNQDGNTDNISSSSFVVSLPPEPLEPAPRLPQELGFINGVDFIPFVDSDNEGSPVVSNKNKPDPKKRKLEAREPEDRSAEKQDRGRNEGGSDHDTPWIRYLTVDPFDSVSVM
jgi:hypothetical protein